MKFKVGDCVRYGKRHDGLKGIIYMSDHWQGSWCFKVHWFHPNYSDDWNTYNDLELIK